MAKYSEEIKKRIVELVEEGEFTMREICKSVGVHQNTVILWKKNKVEFREAIKEAEKKQYKNLGEIAKSSLIKLLKGFEYEEITQEGVTDKSGVLKVKSVRKVKKYVPPQTTAVIFTLKKVDKENFGDEVESTKDPVKIIFEEVKNRND